MRIAIRAATRRLTLVALLALAAQALLPYLHANAASETGRLANHSGDCAVCCALAHGGARAFDTPAAVASALAPLELPIPAPAPVASAPSVDPDSASARAPPASLRLA